MKEVGAFQALADFQKVANQLDATLFVIALLVSLTSSYFTAALYRFFYESRGTGSQVHRSFPLLGISITTLFIGVQMSIPLSLGLLGALSIVRFRTPIKEPEEIGFIMLVVASSISAATLNFRFIPLLLAVAAASTVILSAASRWKFLKRDGSLILTLTDACAEASMSGILEYLKRNFRRTALESSASRDGVTSVQLTFSGLSVEVTELQAGLRRLAPISSIDVFLDRPGGIH